MIVYFVLLVHANTLYLKLLLLVKGELGGQESGEWHQIQTAKPSNICRIVFPQ